MPKRNPEDRELLLQLARCFLDAVGVDPSDTPDAIAYACAVLRAAAGDLDLLAVALTGAAAEDPKLAQTVARMALRLEAAGVAASLILELLPELAATPERG